MGHKNVPMDIPSKFKDCPGRPIMHLTTIIWLVPPRISSVWRFSSVTSKSCYEFNSPLHQDSSALRWRGGEVKRGRYTL